MIDRDASAALAVLADLVAFDTTSRNSNLALIDYAEKLLADLGACRLRIPDATGTKANLLASFGPLDRPGIVLSGHTDVVPVDGQDWSSDPFALSVRDGLAYGRGAADMKGFIACCLAIAPVIATTTETPVHIALSYDEELGCLGAPDLARALVERYGPQRLAIVGEPTLMAPVIGHKGNMGVEIAIRGRAAHSSLAPLTVNAIDVARPFLNLFADIASEAAAAARDDLYDVPTSTVCVTQIEGGNAINTVPAGCRVTAEFRLLPALDGGSYLKRLTALADDLRPQMQRVAADTDIAIRRLFAYPGLETAANEPSLRAVMRAANSNTLSKVAYGTEAGIFSSLTHTPTVIIGPGDIAQAHKPDEFIAVSQIGECMRFLRQMLVDDRA